MGDKSKRYHRKGNAQIEKFKNTARDLGADESEEAFDRTLRKIVNPPSKKGDDDDNKPGQ